MRKQARTVTAKITEALNSAKATVAGGSEPGGHFQGSSMTTMHMRG